MVSIQVKFVNSKAHGVQYYILSLGVNLHFCVILTPIQMNFSLSQKVLLCFYSFLSLATIFLFFYLYRQVLPVFEFKKKEWNYTKFTFVPGFVAQNVRFICGVVHIHSLFLLLLSSVLFHEHPTIYPFSCLWTLGLFIVYGGCK